jgi:SH3 domain-containing YSC84-like protein 1
MRRRTVMIAAMTLALPRVARAQSNDAQMVVDDAYQVIERIRTGSGAATNAREVLHRARGVLIIPALVKAGFFFGGQGGTGVLLSRDSQTNQWSYPAFYDMGAGSFGLQIGLEVSKIVLIVMSDRALNALMSDEFKIGAEAGIAIVTLGAGAEASTTSAGGADIYAFAESMGLFGGIAIQGGIVKPRLPYNHSYYGADVRSEDIVLKGGPRNPGADQLRNDLMQISTS